MNPDTETNAKPPRRFSRRINLDDWGYGILIIAWGGLLGHLFVHDFLIA